MAPRTKHTTPLDGVTGGESVLLSQVDHGLGRKDDFFAAIRSQAAANDPVTTESTSTEGGIHGAHALGNAALGTLDSGLPADATTSTSGTPANAIDIPVQKFLVDVWRESLTSFYSTEDPAKREAQEMADRAVRETLKELVAPEAVLFVPPDEFARVRQEMQQLAEAMVKDAQVLANKRCKNLPINEETLKRGLHRDLTARKFRDRHNALFHYPGIRSSAPETGITPVAAIDGSYGSVGPDHGRILPPGKR